MERTRWAAALGLAAMVALAGYERRALTGSGALAATAVGTATFGGGGLRAAAALIAFFVSGSWLSRRAPGAGEIAAAKGHRRDGWQVLANGGVAAVGSLAASLGAPRGHGATLGALAAAAADTWASEIGVTSTSPPRSIVTGRVVAPGTSGGVTARGWGAAALGSLLVGAAFAAGDRARDGWWSALPGVLAAGLAGSFADSVAGATIQAAYRCRACGRPSETTRHACGSGTELVRGHPWVTNDVVNLIATSVGGAVGLLIWRADGCATLGRSTGLFTG